MVALLLVGATVQGALAVGQQLHRGPLGLALLGEAPPDQLFKYIAPEVGLWRSGGTLGHPNALASYAAALLPVAVAIALSRRPLGSRALGCAAALGSGVALLCTFSRSAWAFSVVAVGGIAVLSGRLRALPTRRGLLAAGLCGVFVLAVFPLVRHRLERTESSATDVRVALALVARDMIKAYPVSGVGLGQFPNRIAEFDPELKLRLFRHPAHNILLLDGAEAGVPGMVASVLMWGGGLVTAWCCAWAAARRRDIESAGLWIGSSALILHNLVDWTLRQPAILSLFWVLVALASARPTSPHDPIADSEQLAGLHI
jgi:O-antigen ligase